MEKNKSKLSDTTVTDFWGSHREALGLWRQSLRGSSTRQVGGRFLLSKQKDSAHSD